MSDTPHTVDALTEQDEAMIQDVIATHVRVRKYYRPLLSVLGILSLVAAALFVRLVLRVQAAAVALDLSFYDGLRFHLVLGRPLTARQLDLISAASTFRAGFIATIFAVSAPFIFSAIHALQSLVTKLSRARVQSLDSSA